MAQRMKLIRNALFLTALAGGTATGQTLTPNEQKMREWIQAHSAEEISYLEKVVNINSGTFNLPGVKAVGDEFAKEFQALGLRHGGYRCRRR